MSSYLEATTDLVRIKRDLAVTGAASVDGNATLGNSVTADAHTMSGSVGVTYSGTSAALTVNQQGTGKLFEVQDSGVARVTVLDGGNVGIGLTNPGQKLHVVGDTRIEGNLTVNGTQTFVNTTVDVTSQLEITNDGTGPALIVNQTGAQQIVDFRDDGVSVMKIIDGGNVGIGSTFGASLPTERLHVLGNVLASGTVTGSSFVGIGSSLTALNAGNISTGTLAVARGGTGAATLTAGKVLVGNGTGVVTQPTNLHWDNTNSRLGIGTTAPLHMFEVAGSIRVGSSVSDSVYIASKEIKWRGDGTAHFSIFNESSTFSIRNTSTNDAMGTVGTSVLSITSGNNVGIGTTNPQATLHVQGGISVTDTIKADKGLTPVTLSSSVATTDAKILFYNLGGVNWAGMGVDQGGRWWLRNGTSSTNLITSDSIGNVGIGTTNPLCKLDVRGDLKIGNKGSTSVDLTLTPWDDPSKNAVIRCDNGFTQYNSRYSHTFYTQSGTPNGTTAPSVPYDTNALTIVQNGNVGIGTTNPLAKLHVNGNIIATNAILNNAGRIMVNQTSCVLQIVSTRIGGGIGIITTTATEVMSLSITPSSTSSKILIIVTMNSHRMTGVTNNYANGSIRRNTIGLCNFIDDLGALHENGETICSAASVLDSPSTTSPVSYNVYVIPNTSDQYRWRNGTMVLQEIAG